ncbi:hypothetical protein LTR70_000855 [Exophiala xenobiotica]|uniref:Uncharacterized protein n=1 Tax=Lithohypha guttulata TaxID=1690604 RepID=A0ABR0KKB7_9EURO|nr:hypothetical protein LTR24_001651 [Lithohypha guttulata]KAK5329019.1 hypothetical protein LTR70_000855 [Exophiala xenobiotica]
MLNPRDQDKGKRPMRNGHLDGFLEVKGLWPPDEPSNKVNGGYETEGQGPSENRSNDPFKAIAWKKPFAAHAVFSLVNRSTSGSAGSLLMDSEPMAPDRQPMASNSRPTTSVIRPIPAKSRPTPSNSRAMTSDFGSITSHSRPTTLDSRPTTSSSGPIISSNWRMRSDGTSNSGINGHVVHGPSHAQGSGAGPVPQGSRSSVAQDREQCSRFSPQAPVYQPGSNNTDNTPTQMRRRKTWELLRAQYQQRQMPTQPERALVQYGQGRNGLTARQPDDYEICLRQAFSNGRLVQDDYNVLASRLSEMAHFQSEMSSKQQALEGGREEVKQLNKDLSLARFAADQARQTAAQAEAELRTAQSDNAALLSRNDQMQIRIQAWEDACNGYAEEVLSNQTETY